MEIALGSCSSSASHDILSLERSLLEVWVLPLGWQGVRMATLNVSNGRYFFLIVSDLVGWHERVGVPSRNELSVSDVSVVHCVVAVDFTEAFLSLLDFVTERGDSAVDVFDVHDVSCCYVRVLLFARCGALNVFDLHLVSDESEGFWCQEFSVLQFVFRVQRISIDSLSLKLDTLRLSTLDIINTHVVFWLI